ncbi:sugar phosphate isomerase/epimerase [Rhodobacter sp. CZR27]|uniref:sugar phosphate isomerase/epimerase family protein n=1 Tax=Rhodobacter sp. CZR27 TaxID=2033869 RepID=UPI000BBF37C9|nr:TIM barrel protein [Rhodobacter sp. CZR27]
MRLAVSNIAWHPQDRAAAYGVLRAHGIRGLEIAPGLFFDRSADPFAPTEAELAGAVGEARAAGLELVSMQSLLFGVEGAALFGAPGERQAFRAGMRRAIALAGRLAIPNLVFGSPRQRVVPATMAATEAREVALETFADLGDAAQAAGTRLGVEFNPAAYGTNFLTTLEEADAFVADLAHPAVTLILDLGSMHLNGAFAGIAEAVAGVASPISHVHVSEPHLAPAPADAGAAATALSALARRGYSGWVSIEMKQPPEAMAAVLGAALGRLMQALDIASEKADPA